MTKQNVTIVLLLFIFSHIFIWWFQIKINIDVVQSIMVWCSIWMGFIITSLVALIDSKYSKYLYKHVKYPSGANGLEVIISYFKWSSYFLLITLALAILLDL